MIFSTCAFCVIAVLSQVHARAPEEQFFGPCDAAFISGNGSLTVGFTRSGRVSSARWPSPGYYDQVSYLTRSASAPAYGVSVSDGCHWAVRTKGKLSWLHGAEWQAQEAGQTRGSTIVEIDSTWPGQIELARQSGFVDPRRNLLVMQLMLWSEDPPEAIYWYQNWNPCNNLVPELPLADWYFESANDFGAFAADDQRRIYHFRPSAVRRGEQTRARGLAAVGASAADWRNAFSSGIWIGSATSNSVIAVQCGPETGPESPLNQLQSGMLMGTPSAAGHCASAWSLLPEPAGAAYIATVFVAFGSTQQEVDSILDEATGLFYARLRHDNQWHWRNYLKSHDQTGDAGAAGAYESALLVLEQSKERATNRMVRAAVTQPPLALVTPKDVAWTGHAWDILGRSEVTEANLDFLESSIRLQDRRSRPLGSLPAALYTTGAEASPHFLLDATGSAWFLSAIWRHGDFLEEGRRKQWFEEKWDSVRLSTDFLVDWTAVLTGEPMPSFDYRRMRDGRSPDLLLYTLMGVESGVNVAHSLGRKPPESWLNERRQLELLLRLFALEEEAALHLTPEVAYWLGGVFPRQPAAAWEIWDLPVAVDGSVTTLGEMKVSAQAVQHGFETGSFPDARTAALVIISGATDDATTASLGRARDAQSQPAL